MPQFDRDRFDDVPRDQSRIGSHRAVPRRGRRWVAFAWAALATGLLVGAGVVWLSVANQSFQFTNPLSSGSASPEAGSGSSEGPEASDGAEPEATPTPTAADPATVDPTITTITVLNATDTAGLAARAADTLQEAGWTVGSQGNANDTAPTTIVYYGSEEDQAVALGVAQALGISGTQQTDAFPGAAVTVVLGEDQAG